MALAALLEEVVRRFPRYHKYALGADLRRQAYAVCCGVVQAGEGSERLQAARIRIAALPRLLRSLRRMRQSHVLVLERGYLKTGFKCWMFHSLWWPALQAVTSPSLRPFER
ncbi:MAG: hypothetical protein RKO25_02075 [Candidatus Contendobacter sp.]|nr:hypothetical protein [Candidatus Contendobacter sp.]